MEPPFSRGEEFRGIYEDSQWIDRRVNSKSGLCGFYPSCAPRVFGPTLNRNLASLRLTRRLCSSLKPYIASPHQEPVGADPRKCLFIY
jgi:hypothetical protein